jgi:uncharacterized protein
MYYQVIAQCTQSLKNLEICLDKAERYAATKNFDIGVLMSSRLAPDMQPFTYQVQSACDYVKGAAAWLSGQTPPRHEDNEQTIDELRARIRKTVAFAGSMKEAQYAHASESKVKLSWAPDKVLRRGLPAANDNPQHFFPHRDGVCHPPPQRRRRRQDGFSWFYQSGGRLIV